MWAAVLLLTLATFVVSIPTMSTSGTKFYDSNGKQFYIKGVVYGEYIYSSNKTVDFLTNMAQCQSDVALMQKLGINTISIDYVDSTANHDGCMTVFENAGIYVLVALDSPHSRINELTPTWTIPQYNNFTAVMDAFATYDNTLGFVTGGETVVNLSTSNSAPYVKASAVDLKKYRDGKGYRQIPVGYAGSNDPILRAVVQNYLACGTYAIDFYALNSYSWCRGSSFTTSNFNGLYAASANYNIPMFFSEVGCNINPPRDFGEMASILGADMEKLWSGAIVYEWGEAGTNFGLVSYVTTSISGTPTPASTGGFSALMSQWSTLNPTGTPSSLYTPTVTPPLCPSVTPSGWTILGNAPLPTLNKAAVITRSTSSSPSSSSLLSSPSSPVSTQATSTSLGGTFEGASNFDGGDGLSSASIAGIVVGIILFFIVGGITFYVLWHRGRRQRRVSPSLDLTPEGLEVGEPPSNPGTDSSQVETMHGGKQELQDTSSMGLNRYPLTSNTAMTTSTLGLAEMDSSSISKRASNDDLFRANAPWETQAFPSHESELTTTQQTPLLSTTEVNSELRRIEDEERRIDAQIAEAERIQILKQEKVLLQARKTALLEAKEKAGGT